MTNRSSEAEKEIARARAACLEKGLTAEEVARLFLNEAMLAWMVDGLSEHEIHERLATAVRDDLREWFYRARIATGQCDCVREVHFEGLEEMKGRRSIFTAEPSSC